MVELEIDPENTIYRYYRWVITNNRTSSRYIIAKSLLFFDENKTKIDMSSVSISSFETDPNNNSVEYLISNSIDISSLYNNWISYKLIGSYPPIDTNYIYVILDLGIDYITKKRPYYYSWITGTGNPPNNTFTVQTPEGDDIEIDSINFDPISWVMSASFNGNDWARLNEQNNYSITINRNTEITNGEYLQLFTNIDTPIIENCYQQLISTSSFNLSKRTIIYYPYLDTELEIYKYQIGHIISNNSWTTPPISITSHTINTTLNNDDDLFNLILTNNNKFKFYDKYYTSINIGTNGYLTFDYNDTQYLESPDNHFNMTRLSIFFTDLSPNQQGLIYYGYHTDTNTNDTLVITYLSVSQYNTYNSNNAQIKLYLENAILSKRGRIEINYGLVELYDCIIGISNGLKTNIETINYAELTNEITPQTPLVITSENEQIITFDIGVSSLPDITKIIKPISTFLNPVEKFTNENNFNLAGNTIIYYPFQDNKYTLTKTNDNNQWTEPPISITGDNLISVSNNYNMDEGYTGLSLPISSKFKFYDTIYSTVYIGTNGYITFDSSDITYEQTIANFLNKTRIGIFLNDLSAKQQGEIYYGYHTDTNTNDTLVITYLNITEYKNIEDNIYNSNNAQIKLYLENAILSKRGRIEISYGKVEMTNCIIGLSNRFKKYYTPIIFNDLNDSILYNENENLAIPEPEVQSIPDPEPEPTPEPQPEPEDPDPTINNPPTVQNLYYTTFKNNSVNIRLLGKDIDNSPNPLTYSIINNPSNGILEQEPEAESNIYIYTPTLNYNGIDQFTYKAYDGLDYSSIATVYLTIRTTEEQYNSIVNSIENESELNTLNQALKDKITNDVSQINPSMDYDYNINIYIELLNIYKAGATITASSYQLILDTIEKKDAVHRVIRAEMYNNNLTDLTILNTNITQKNNLLASLTSISDLYNNDNDVNSRDIIIKIINPYPDVPTIYSIDYTDIDLFTQNVYFDISKNESVNLINSGSGITANYTMGTTGIKDSDDNNYYLDNLVPLGDKSFRIYGLGSILNGQLSYHNPVQQFSVDSGSPIDLSGTILNFYPTTSTSYSINIEQDIENGAWTSLPFPVPVTNLLTDNTLGLDDGSYLLDLSDNLTSFKFCNEVYNQIYIGTNGYLTFYNSDQTYEPTIRNHFNTSRLSFLYGDLLPDFTSNYQLRITYNFESIYSENDFLVINYYNVKEYAQPNLRLNSNKNNCQILLGLETALPIHRGTIKIYYGLVGISSAIVGISDGTGSEVSNYTTVSFTDIGNIQPIFPTQTPDVIPPVVYLGKTNPYEEFTYNFNLSGRTIKNYYSFLENKYILKNFNGSEWTTTPPYSISSHTAINTIAYPAYYPLNLNDINNSFNLYGKSSNTYINIGLFGSIVIGTSSSTPGQNLTLADFISKPRIGIFANGSINLALGGNVYYGYETDTNLNDMLIITYYNLTLGFGTEFNAQVILYLNNASVDKLGCIDVYYGKVSNTISCIIGLSDGSNNTGTMTNINYSSLDDVEPETYRITDTDPMILEIFTELDGDEITLPLYTNYGSTIDNHTIVYWDSSDFSIFDMYRTSGEKTHTYSISGTYIINIYGRLLQFGNGQNGYSNSNKLTKVISLGNIGLKSLSGAFYNAINLIEVPRVLPSTITNLEYCFSNSFEYSFNDILFNDSNVILWDVSNVINMSYMFYGAKKFNQNLGSWNIVNVEYMTNMLYITNLSTNNYDNILNGWSKINYPKPYVDFTYSSLNNSGNGYYSYGSSIISRQKIITNRWTINDDGLTPIISEPLIRLKYQVSTNGQITLPLNCRNLVINWGDGEIENINNDIDPNSYSVFNSLINHTYIFSGIYIVNIYSIDYTDNNTPDFLITEYIGKILKFGLGYKSYQNVNKLIEVINFNTDKIFDLSGAFNGASSLVSVPSNIPTTVSNLNYTFYNASSFNQDLSTWNINNILNMTNMLYGSGYSRENYEKILVEWSGLTGLKSNVKLGVGNIKYSYGQPLTSRNILTNTYNWIITDGGLPDITGLPIGLEYNIDNPNNTQITIPVTMQSNNEIQIVFENGITYSYYNIIGSTNINYTYQPGITGLQIVNIYGNLYQLGLDSGISSYNNSDKLVYVASFGHLDLVSIAGAFNGASSLISVPNTLPPTITNMDYTFYNASGFNQDLSYWDVSNVTGMTGMFQGASLSKENYDLLLTEWSGLILQPNVYFNAGLTTKYSYGEPIQARKYIIDNFGWTIIDGGIEDYPSGSPMILKYNVEALSNLTISLPLYGTVNVSVYWDDETLDNYTTEGIKNHTYLIPGIYTIRIYGNLQTFGNGLNTDTTNFDKLTEIVSFGDIQLESLSGGFKDAINLITVPQILPSTIKILKYTFYNTTLLNDPNIIYWDTSNVINMSYTFFNATSFKQNLENWDKSNVEEQYYMFYGSGTYEQNEDLLLDKILNILE